jgi:Fe-S cluster assembly protein SufD
MNAVADPTIAAGVFSRHAVAALSRQLGEPDWMQQKRQLAWSLFAAMPMPTLRDDHWRRTDLRPLKWDTLRLPEGVAGARAASIDGLPAPLRAALDAQEEAAGRLVSLNGQALWHEVAPALVAQGVVFTDMASAVREHPDLVQRHFMTECVAPSDSPARLSRGDDKFAALHGALWNGGAFIYVPKGVRVDRPFEIVVGLDGEGSAIFPHTLIVAERESVVTVIEDSLSLNSAKQAFAGGVTEIIAGDGAQVTYADLQRWGEHVFSFNTRRALHHPNSRVLWEIGQLGSRLSKTYVDSILSGDGASTRFNGVYFVNGRQHIDLDTLMHHSGRGTAGDLLIKGAAQERGRVVFTGMIRIEKSGLQTDSYLKSDNLILSDRARVDSIPGLVIDADDVRASHGATVGRVDEEHIFYLQSRGIPRSVAVRMVVEGFFASVFDRMSQERVRRKLATAVSAKLGNH